MAQLQLQPPDPFNFKNPDEWPRWKRRFEQFRSASGLTDDPEQRQVSTLLYCLGETAEDVLRSTHISDNERKKYDTVLAKFDGFFQVRKNVIFERARFNRRSQLPDETSEQYITALYHLVENCAYGDLTDEMIRDRLVVGIRDKSLSERLQMDADLTLEKAKKSIRQREAVHEQQEILESGIKQEPSSLDAMGQKYKSNFKRRNQPSSRPSPQTSRHQSTPQTSNRKCFRCGRSPHPRAECPASQAVCHKCKKKGHFSSVCQSKSVGTVEEEPDTCYLNTVYTVGEKSWTSHVKINGQMKPFKLDTGAEVTAISPETFQSIHGAKLSRPNKTLCGPDRKPLKVLGTTEVELSIGKASCTQNVYVLEKLKSNLLGLPAIVALKLLTTVDSIKATPKESIINQFPKLFNGLGSLEGDFTIHLKPDARPYSLFTPRNVPIPLRTKVKKELDRMETLGVIAKVEEPTDWCAGMVVVPKRSGDVRICVDLKPLNESVLREVHPLPKVDDTLAQLAGAAVFSKLDANSGFWQIPLAKPSRHLTTFITPFGRYCFNKMPFGISSAPEHFQKRMSKILSGLDGVLCQMDDILIHGRSQEEHDRRLVAALNRIQSSGVTLNPDKCEFNKEKLTFLGHVISKEGIAPDPKKTTAICQMKAPSTVSELRRFMGMVNQLSKFSPQVAEVSKPLRELLSVKRAWLWGPRQEEAFVKIKEVLSQPTVLAHYDPTRETKVSADASAYGLGAVLLQRHDEGWKPVTYASRSMSETESRYAQIEKEALAATWASEKFSEYLIGKQFHIETDHKPLVPILSTKSLDQLPPRVLRFRLRLMRFHYTIAHVPGKFLYTADTLSRAPLPCTTTHLEEITEFFIDSIVSQLPANKDRLESYRSAQATDPTCSTLLTYCREGWPQRNTLKGDLVPYWSAKSELTIHDRLLLFRDRIVIPKCLQRQTLQKIHQGHQGIQRCRERISRAVWWPGVSREIEEYVSKCPECTKNHPQHREPLIPSPLPNHPWEKVGADLFELNGATYLLVVDYFSRFPEAVKLTSTTSKSIINALKAIFFRHGIPAVLMSDNGPQFDSTTMKAFASEYSFTHTTSSPHYPQSNGLVERTVKTVKQRLNQSTDPYMAMLSYRATPLPWCGFSPAELLMGRRIRTDVPQVSKTFVPQWPYLQTFSHKDKEFKAQQKLNYDRRHRTKSLPQFPDDTPVWVRTNNNQTPGRITSASSTPRSYIVSTPSGQVRRNRLHLAPRIPETTVQPTTEDINQTPQSNVTTRLRSGTAIRPPERLTYWRKGDVA